MRGVAILMVCRHNICRSPLAEGILVHALKTHGMQRMVKVDSAGTHVGMAGQRTDERARKVARMFGVKLKRGRSRRVVAKDFEKFDYILAMDQDNYRDLLQVCPDELVYKLALIRSFCPETEQPEIPDPFYGSVKGFENTYQLLDSAVTGLIDELRRNVLR